MRKWLLIALVVGWVGVDLATVFAASHPLVEVASFEKFEEIDSQAKEERLVQARQSVVPVRPQLGSIFISEARVAHVRVSKRFSFYPDLHILHRTLLL